MLTFNLHGGVYDSSKSVCQARYVIVEPVAVSQQDPINITNEILPGLHSLLEPARATFLLTFNQKDDVGVQALLIGELMGRVDGSHDRSFVVRSAPTIQVASFSSQREGVVFPLAVLVFCRDNIVVPIKQNLLTRGRCSRITAKFGKYNWVVLACIDHLGHSAKIVENGAQVRRPSTAVSAIFGQR